MCHVVRPPHHRATVKTTRLEYLRAAHLKDLDLFPKLPPHRYPPDSNKRNFHPRDTRIRFDPGPHKYFVDGATTTQYISSTGIVEFFFGGFEKMKGYMSVSCAKSKKPPWTSLYTPRQVIDFWDAVRDAGTARHAANDDYLQGRPHEYPSPSALDDLKLGPAEGFFKFLDDHPDWIPYRSEFSVFDEEFQIAGQIDALFIDKAGDIILVDWKHVRDLSGHETKEKGLRPLTLNVEANHANCYALQLNIYDYMLRKHYGIKPVKRYIVNFSWLPEEARPPKKKRRRTSKKGDVPQVIEMEEKEPLPYDMVEVPLFENIEDYIKDYRSVNPVVEAA